MNDDAPNLGPCCICEQAPATVVVMLPRRLPEGGEGGWGCVLCGIEGGAYAVLCEPCCARYAADNSILVSCCAGYPAIGERLAIADLPEGEFDHDPAKHPEMQPPAEQPMQLLLESTDQVKNVHLPGDKIVEARMWQGQTTRGTPVLADIVGVVPLDMGSDVDAEFESLRLMGSQTAARQ